jgi:hypothetical protein
LAVKDHEGEEENLLIKIMKWFQFKKLKDEKKDDKLKMIFDKSRKR